MATCPTPLPVSALGIGVSCCDVSPLRVEHRLYKRASYTSASLPHRGIAYVKMNDFRRYLKKAFLLGFYFAGLLLSFWR